MFNNDKKCGLLVPSSDIFHRFLKHLHFSQSAFASGYSKINYANRKIDSDFTINLSVNVAKVDSTIGSIFKSVSSSTGFFQKKWKWKKW